MSNSAARKKIAIFGHYGNQNMGDEAIIEAAISNMRKHVPGSEVVCMSINPFDSAERHGVDSFPIRNRDDFFNGTKPASPSVNKPAASKPAANQPAAPAKKTTKQKIKALPIIGALVRLAVYILDTSKAVKREMAFLKKGKAYLQDIDLLMITGSNQFLDNFGGAWGFPYTLLKWTLLAKATNTKVAFVSIGAGPLNLPLSFKMLSMALGKADYVSYRDEGSKELVESKIDIDAPVYPDVAHSLGYQSSESSRDQSDEIVIAINPMPVYDKRYWYIPDEEKFLDYVNKVYALSLEVLSDGNKLVLFSTQTKDENVIDDLVELLEKHENYSKWQSQIEVVKCKEVDELMGTIDKSDLVVATRFHATVLPLQLSKPTVGICYYRKAAELLDEFGMSDFHVDIDNFDAATLISMYKNALPQRAPISEKISTRFAQYTDALEEQYTQIAKLVN